MGKELYVLFHCDEWKSTTSLSLAGVFTSLERLNEGIQYFVKEDSMNLNLDHDKDNVRSINTALEFGYIEVVEANATID